MNLGADRCPSDVDKSPLIASVIPRSLKDGNEPKTSDSSICAARQIQGQENWLNPLTSVALPRKNGVLWLTLNPTGTGKDLTLEEQITI